MRSRHLLRLTMALVCRPALLVADEPTTALDVTIQAQILKLINDLQSELQMAVLMITHDLGVVANVADEIVVMYHGGVLERGSLQYFRDEARSKVLGEFDLRGAHQTDCEFEETKRVLRGTLTWGVTPTDVGRPAPPPRGRGGGQRRRSRRTTRNYIAAAVSDALPAAPRRRLARAADRAERALCARCMRRSVPRTRAERESHAWHAP